MLETNNGNKSRSAKYGRQWSYNEVLVRQRLVLKRPQEQPETWPADWHPDPDRWPTWLPRGWWQVRMRGYPKSAWVSPEGVLFKWKERIRKHLDSELRDGRYVEGTVKSHFPYEKDPETDTCPCYWPFRLPQDWRIGLKFKDNNKPSMCYYPPGDDMNYLATLAEVEKAIADSLYDPAFPAAPPVTSLLQAAPEEDKNMRLWTYKEVIAFRERRPTNLPQKWPEGWQLDPGRWNVWLPQGWFQVRRVGKDGISRLAWVSPEGSLCVRKEQVQTQLTSQADAAGKPQVPRAFPDEWPALLPQDWRMAVILGTDWGPPTMRFFPPGDNNRFVSSANDAHRALKEALLDPSAAPVGSITPLAPQHQPSAPREEPKAEPQAEPKAQPKARARNRRPRAKSHEINVSNEERPCSRLRTARDNEEEIKRKREELEAQLTAYMLLCQRQEQASMGMQRSKASRRAASGATAAAAATVASHDDPERANGTFIHDSERDLW